LSRWHLELSLPDSDAPLFLRIARAVADAIRSGRVSPGGKLPGTRTLARALGVHRNTVTAAYAELLQEGWIEARRGSGTTVSRHLPLIEHQPRSPAQVTGTGFDLQPGTRPFADEPLEPGLLKWDFGLPDVRLAPVKPLLRELRRTIVTGGEGVLQYLRYGARRLSNLQRELAHMLNSLRGCQVVPEQIVLTQGSQMGLYLTARALLRPGDVVAVEDPSYPIARSTFEYVGARVAPIPVDDEGLRVDALQQLVTTTPVRAVYVTPHHQFPTTVVLSAARRLALSRLCSHHRIALIEDDFDHDFHYEGRPLLPLLSTEVSPNVIYLGSLSKLLAPGLRVGYLVARPEVAAVIAGLRQLVDIQGSELLHAPIAALLEDGELQRHLNRARLVFKARRDFLMSTLERRLGHVLDWQTPAGGLAVWVRCRGVDVEQWRAAARQRGLLVRTGGLFFFDGRPRPFLRLGFARLSERELDQATELLARSLPRKVAPR
jgi:GntR family transcriptional regulator/MocR family aminotransferase